MKGQRMRFEIEEEGSRYKGTVYNWKVIESSEYGKDNLIATSTDDYESVEECLVELARFIDHINEEGVDMLKDLLRRRELEDLLRRLGLGDL